jgi:hypothetical protein
MEPGHFPDYFQRLVWFTCRAGDIIWAIPQNFLDLFTEKSKKIFEFGVFESYASVRI